MKKKETRGGLRRGAGPKKKDVTRIHIMRVTAQEKQVIMDLRKPKLS